MAQRSGKLLKTVCVGRRLVDVNHQHNKRMKNEEEEEEERKKKKEFFFLERKKRTIEFYTID
jgi:hypothetical protein